MQVPKGKAPDGRRPVRGSACSRAKHPCQVCPAYPHPTTSWGGLSSGIPGSGKHGVLALIMLFVFGTGESSSRDGGSGPGRAHTRPDPANVK